jgi:hypothetical protein
MSRVIIQVGDGEPEEIELSSGWKMKKTNRLWMTTIFASVVIGVIATMRQKGLVALS